MHIIFEEIIAKYGVVGQITLNRPQTLNALTHDMTVSLSHQLTQWAQNPAIKIVLIQSQDPRAFCAGGDLRQLYIAGQNSPLVDQFFYDEYQLNYQIKSFPKPYIALLNGITMGGGVGISVHGSLCIATENLNWAMPETGIGFFPDIGASYFLPRCPHYLGYYLGLTGARISAVDAYYAGLVDVIVPSEKLPDVQAAIFKASSPNQIPELIKAYIANANAQKSDLEIHHATIARCFNHRTIENIMTALEQEKSDWCQQTLNTLQKKSPTSLKVTLEALQRGSILNLADCLGMEYGMAQRFLNYPDLYEGIRAQMIDKDQTPHWKPLLLSEVTNTLVAEFFQLPNKRFIT